ncbi:MAG: tetratricopeptide repeat protein [Chryseobacterium sp.]|nr:tetratricopeptide repeat protein [Chryseobacterium sp.]
MITALKITFNTILLFLCISYSQSLYAQKSAKLKNDIKQNGVLFNENLDKAFREIDGLLKISREQKNYSAELTLLDRKCRYFYSKNKIDDLIESAEELDAKSLLYNDSYYQGMANIYLAEAFSINGLNDRALSYLDKAYSILNADNSGQKKIFFAKANVLISYGNIYSDKGEPRKAVQKLREVIKSYNELKNDKEIDQFQYVNYSNLASIYADYNIDSARYFALKSVVLKPLGKDDDSIMMLNYFILGQAYEKSGNIEEAMKYFHKALITSEKTGTELNKKKVYNSLVELYKKSNKKDSAIIYENKLKQLEISILESKYNSLQKVIEVDEKTKSHNNFKWIYILLIIVIVAGVFIFYIFKKNKPKVIPRTLNESYSMLTELARNSDPAFMFTFEQVFPNFSEKLLKINPELQKSEIEFCALLKLNLSTKDIAKITFIEPRTVQNKKYRIRKRLNIPQSVDIYNWFNTNF